MRGYWVGVCVGGMTAVVMLCMALLIMLDRDRMWKREVNELKKQVEELSQTVEEDRKIMQTYKFFNESWQAIIDMRNGKED